ncbi:MAG: Nin1 binding protein [Thelocarpon superellum]|nr:MAG: Nin1 binding protein [Thelocarpon superellum]
MPDPTPIHTIILDAGPILKNDPTVSTLLAQSELILTVPSVLTEIRDAAARARVETALLPFLTFRTPKPENLKIVTDFARKTGDLEVLSRPDLQIAALAYELECERNGGNWRLRSVPGQKGLNGAPPQRANLALAAATVAEAEACTGAEANAIVQADVETLGREETMASDLETITPSLGQLDLEGHPGSAEADHSESDAAEDVQATAASGDSDSDGWITPSNIKRHQAKDTGALTQPSQEQKVMQVATMTTDFALQNVLLQMNLNLVSPQLQRVRHLKTYLLRCHACFAKTKDMSKQFCSRCGKPTLMRVSCSTLDNGEFKIHLKKNMQWNTRGNKFSIPKPVGGSSSGKLNVGGGGKGGGQGGWGQGLILAEDQKEYVQALTTRRRVTERDLMDEDYLPAILTGERGRTGGRPKVGGGRNINSRKRM